MGRNREFDISRAVFIIIAIILHYNSRFNLGFIAKPFLFFNSNFFNVGTFFFFTAGYMGHSIYLKKIENNSLGTTFKIVKKGSGILFLYIGFIIFMRLATQSAIPHHPYVFIFRHYFFTKVLFMFSILYILSPILLAIYSRSKPSFFILIAIIYIIYVFPFSYDWLSEEWMGVLFRVGSKGIEYCLFSSLISYSIGFLFSIIDKNYISKNSNLKLFGLASILILVCHYFFMSSYQYWPIAHSRGIYILTTSTLPFMCILMVRTLLTSKRIGTFITYTPIMVIGIKTLTFYVVSNMILGFVRYTVEPALSYKLVVFFFLFAITYLFTSWHFYSEIHAKSMLKQ